MAYIRQLLGPLGQRIKDRSDEAKALIETEYDKSEAERHIQEVKILLEKIKNHHARYLELYYKLVETAQTDEAAKKKLEKDEHISDLLIDTEDIISEISSHLEQCSLDTSRIQLDSKDIVGDSGLELMKLEMEKMKLNYQLEKQKAELLHQNEMEKMKLTMILKEKEKETSPSSESNSGGNLYIKLPKLDFEKFSGDILLWHEFWDSFESAIDTNKQLRDVDKLNYLRSKLGDPAKAVITGLELTNENYKVAVQSLKQRYGDKTKIINARYEAILTVQASGHEVKKLRKMFDTIEMHLRALEAVGEDVDNNLMKYVIWSKLPSETKIRLEEKRSDGNWSLSELRKEIDQYISARYDSIGGETNTLDLGYEEQRTLTSTTEALLSNETTNSNKKRCIYCNLNHWSDQCQKYSTIKERKEFLKGRCMKCLQLSHDMSFCRNNKICVYCKKQNDHHRSLCPSQFKEEPTMLATGDKVLMNTALIEVKSKHESARVRVFLDCGSYRSFISTNLADKLRLEKKSEQTLSVSTFGAEAPKPLKSSTTEVELVKKDGSSIKFNLDIVSKITGNMSRKPINNQHLHESYNRIMSNLADTMPTELEQSSIDL